MDLLLIRHALPLRVETSDGSAADPALSPEGQRQAEQLADRLGSEPLDALYTSPLRRAQETAAPLARRLSLTPRLEAGVIEFDAAASRYVPLEELKSQDYAAWKSLVDSGFYLEGDAAKFRTTVVEALEAVVSRHGGQRVAVVCHGGVINAWTSHLLGVERLFLFEPAYTSVSRFAAARSGERSLVSLNEAPHLRG